MNIYRNQYLILDSNINYNNSINFLKENIGTYTVYYDQNLSISKIKQDFIEIILLGFILDPFNPILSDNEILKHISTKVNSTVQFINELQKYSGRFVLLFKTNNSIIAINDSCGLRQIYYGNDKPFAMSSSPELILSALGYNFQIEKNIENLFANINFLKNEFPWYGDTWYDSRVKKVLPNHYLDIDELTARRIDYYYDGPETYNDIINYAKSIFSGSIQAIHHRYKIILQPITAGWDSRILLAASRELTKKTNYYLFVNPELKSTDSIVATNLAKKLDIKFQLIPTKPLTKEFIEIFSKKYAVPRILYKTANIQWHFENSQDLDAININGNGAGIVRCTYSARNRKGTISELTRITKFGGFFKDDLLKWMAESKNFSETSGIENLDLFYWEQKMGNWGALYPYEQDIAIEEFSPFNNKNLLYAIFKIDSSKRKFPDYKFFNELIKQLWPATLTEPINPILGFSPKARLQYILRSSSLTLYLMRKLRFRLR